ncbi:MAG TPA: winged helix DNA-binding protein [Solirubrobacteraceae bacterium]
MDPLYELALSIKAAHRALDRAANEAMEPLGITAAQADALTVIRLAGPLSLRELGELLIAESGHPSRLVDRLVAAGLVERAPAEADRRRVVLSLTARGRRLEKRGEAARRQVFDLGRQLVGDRDLAPPLEFLRELLAPTEYGELIARRRTLVDRDSRVSESARG